MFKRKKEEGGGGSAPRANEGLRHYFQGKNFLRAITSSRGICDQPYKYIKSIIITKKSFLN